MVELIVFVLATAIMFIPSIVAFNKGLKYRWFCLFLNLVLGWLVVPWIALLVWSIAYKNTGL